jgi:hypothetical protein
MGRPTVRISLKTIAMLFPSDSVERVCLHGKWQLGRGRNPSMVFGNHFNAKEAFVAANEMVGGYFDEIRHLPNSRHRHFWHKALITAVQNRVPAQNLPRPPLELWLRGVDE